MKPLSGSVVINLLAAASVSQALASTSNATDTCARSNALNGMMIGLRRDFHHRLSFCVEARLDIVLREKTTSKHGRGALLSPNSSSAVCDSFGL